MSKENDELQEALVDIFQQFDVNMDEVSPQTAEEMKAERKGDVAQVIKNTEGRLEELHVQGDRLLQAMGMTSEEAESHADNPANYSKGQWAALQNFKNKLAQYKKHAFEEMGVEGKEEKKSSSRRRKKKKFAKKKDWLQL
ncbi:MAG: hypothetical protein KR126chlam2_00308 [Chlamydiae bacterium]|nr:hypothetical protein [Chlamydiota bacterium]